MRVFSRDSAGVVGLGAALIGALLAGQLPAAGGGTNRPTVEFNRDIRGILADKCFACHGPDEQQRQAGLRLDVKEGMFGDRAGEQIIVPGNSSRSALFRRISTEDESVRMPPAYLGHEKLSDGDIAVIRRWIEQGAKWQEHWSFIAPQRPGLPGVKSRDWPRNAIDYFVLRRLEGEGIRPSSEADRARLIRRAALDLTGLPPTPAEVRAFLNDRSPRAYERVVDRLLQSPRYGERMAVRWLDAARYADTNGYSSDGVRSMWRWRDWVIDAFNRNLPFDQFTVEQIAGDLLPDATRDQIIATGFNRNHRTTAEGGVIDEEFRVEYVADRVETTSTVWLGLTVGCARCHDHKYDPITQKEFYQLFAYFNNVPEKGLVYDYGNEEPYIKAPTPDQEAKLIELDRKVTAAEGKFAALKGRLTAKQREWEQWVRDSQTPDWSIREGLILHFPLDGDVREGTGVYERRKSFDANVTADLAEKTEYDRRDPAVVGAADETLPFVPGRVGQAGSFDGKRFVDAGKVANFNYLDPFSLMAWIYPTAGNGAIISSVEDVAKGEGYGLYLREGKLRFHYTRRWTDIGFRLEAQRPLELNRWHHVLATYDGKRKAKGAKVYVNGKAQQVKVLWDGLSSPLVLKAPFRIGAGEGPQDRFHGYIDDVRAYNRALSADEVVVVPLLETIPQIAAVPPEARGRAQANKLAFCFLDQYAPQDIRQARREWLDLRQQREEFLASVPTVMVMKESERPRQAHVLKRGAYDAPGEKVDPGVPKVLPPLKPEWENNRLGFARWLVDRSNPLTARVTVNRFWQMLFGVGLVKTAENLGSQGESPPNQDLLDWLAVEFMESGWDVKGILKTMVMSSTYRQSSKLTPELLERDPENRLLARGPRLRLSAEMIRDQALAVSGLLAEQVGGPSVKPYQPPGLWKELTHEKTSYVADSGDKLYRRSLYTFWRRTVAPPSMITFDASDRESCTVREKRTNTPLQALNLMNDVTYVEASRKLAERMMKEGGTMPEERIAYAFELATSRPPREREGNVLRRGYRRFLDGYRADPNQAAELLSEGESPVDESLDPVELASYSSVASLILNLDETITKE